MPWRLSPSALTRRVLRRTCSCAALGWCRGRRGPAVLRASVKSPRIFAGTKKKDCSLRGAGCSGGPVPVSAGGAGVP
eukprot:5045415-Alexandrium_andersonii.AAC.1